MLILRTKIQELLLQQTTNYEYNLLYSLPTGQKPRG